MAQGLGLSLQQGGVHCRHALLCDRLWRMPHCQPHLQLHALQLCVARQKAAMHSLIVSLHHTVRFAAMGQHCYLM